jgi:hypothetical protein
MEVCVQDTPAQPLYSTVTTATLWNWPRCPPADDWIKNMYMVEYYSARKKNGKYVICKKMGRAEVIKLSKIKLRKASSACALSYAESRQKKSDMSIKQRRCEGRPVGGEGKRGRRDDCD